MEIILKQADRAFSILVGQTEASVGIFTALDFQNFGRLLCRTNSTVHQKCIIIFLERITLLQFNFLFH